MKNQYTLLLQEKEFFEEMQNNLFFMYCFPVYDYYTGKYVGKEWTNKTAEENYNKCDELIKMIDKKLANL